MTESQISPVQDKAPTMAWRTVVHDDPVNLMSYVQWVFESYLGLDSRTAHKLMMKVHVAGRAVVSSGSKEAMETDVQAMHTYGLWATLEEDA